MFDFDNSRIMELLSKGRELAKIGFSDKEISELLSQLLNNNERTDCSDLFAAPIAKVNYYSLKSGKYKISLTTNN